MPWVPAPDVFCNLLMPPNPASIYLLRRSSKSIHDLSSYLFSPGISDIVEVISNARPDFGAVGLGPAFFFSFFAHRRPHALQRLFGPVGPFRHSGESRVPVRMSQRFTNSRRDRITAISTDIFVGDLDFLLLVPCPRVFISWYCDSNIATNQCWACVACANSLATLAVLIS
jgi:hypothetical protein